MSKKRKLPSYTLKEALEKVNPCDPVYYTVERIKPWFPRKRRITARDVLKVPARKFTRPNTWRDNDKVTAAARLMPIIVCEKWLDWFDDENVCVKIGSSTDIKMGLKLCDMYERGELDE